MRNEMFDLIKTKGGKHAEIVERVTNLGSMVIAAEPDNEHRLLTILTMLDFELRSMLDTLGITKAIGMGDMLGNADEDPKGSA